MATKINGPRPATRLGLASDVRDSDYLKRIKSSVKKPMKARSSKPKARSLERGR